MIKEFKVLVSIILLLIAFQGNTEPLVYGHSFQHDSKVLQEQRRYMVSLPERYQAEKFHYPTLYILDADFQFHHVANTVKHLARMGKIPQMIVIGVANQGPRDYLSSNTWPIAGESDYGNMQLFSEYIKTELIPTIDSQYRTNKRRAISGYSLGGLFVMQSYIDPNTPFNGFLAMSPSVWFDDYAYKSRLEKYFDANPKYQNPLFISVANEVGMGVQDVVKLMPKTKSAEDKFWSFKHYPDETHYSTALPALYDGLVFLAPNHFVDYAELKELESIERVFEKFLQKKSSFLGFKLDWLQSYTLAKYLIGTEQTHLIPQVLELARVHFPDSKHELGVNLALMLNRKKEFKKAIELLGTIKEVSIMNPKWYHQMSVAYRGVGDQVGAKKYHQKALELANENQLESWEYWELEPYNLR